MDLQVGGSGCAVAASGDWVQQAVHGQGSAGKQCVGVCCWVGRVEPEEEQMDLQVGGSG
jgi:hypothetical protein